MQSWSIPKIRTTLSKKHGQLNSLFDTLVHKSYDPIKWGYGGLRIEVRINAPTLAEAKFITNKYKYFDWDNLNNIQFLKVLIYLFYYIFTNYSYRYLNLIT
jgi:hypothetical protein